MDKNVMPESRTTAETLPLIKSTAVDLLPSASQRWVSRRKAAIVNAVRSGTVSLEEVCRRYELTVEEFLSWQHTMETRGVARGQPSSGRSKDRPKSTTSSIRTGKLDVNLVTRVVSVDNQPVRLTEKEYLILELLSLRKGSLLTKEGILNHLYRKMAAPKSKIVDILVRGLRKKLAQATSGAHYIDTRPGRGYVLREPTAMPAATGVVIPPHLSGCHKEAGTGAAKENRPSTKGLQRPGEAEPQPSVRDRSVRRRRMATAASGIKQLPGSFPVGVWFEDAVTIDGGPLRIPRPDPAGSLYGCATARCHE